MPHTFDPDNRTEDVPLVQTDADSSDPRRPVVTLAASVALAFVVYPAAVGFLLLLSAAFELTPPRWGLLFVAAVPLFVVVYVGISAVRGRGVSEVVVPLALDATGAVVDVSTISNAE